MPTDQKNIVLHSLAELEFDDLYKLVQAVVGTDDDDDEADNQVPCLVYLQQLARQIDVIVDDVKPTELLRRLGGILDIVSGRTSFTRAQVYRETRDYFQRTNKIRAAIARACLGHKKFALAISRPLRINATNLKPWKQLDKLNLNANV